MGNKTGRIHIMKKGFGFILLGVIFTTLSVWAFIIWKTPIFGGTFGFLTTPATTLLMGISSLIVGILERRKQ